MTEPSSRSSHAITRAHAELREAGRAIREARSLLNDTMTRHDSISAHLNMALTDLEAIAAGHQRLLLGVLRVLDDCAHVLGRTPEIAVVHDGLLGLLDDQGVKPIAVAAGDPFNGELHESQETVTAADLPHGTVVDVIARGYLRRDGDTTVVVRPATVRVNAQPKSR